MFLSKDPVLSLYDPSQAHNNKIALSFSHSRIKRMVRTPCCRAEGLKKGAWTQEEDQKLIAYVQQHGEGGWRTLPDKAGLKRCGKSCRLRWANYLRPDIKRGEFSQEEENSMIRLHAIHGNKWSAIARSLPGRTDNEIKNHWNTHIKKRLVKKGIDPLTHKPLLDGAGKSSYHPENPPEKTSVQQKEDDQILDNNKSPGSLSARFLNRVANRFGQRINHSVLSNIIGSGGPLTSQSSHTTSASEFEKSTSSSSTSTSSNFLVSQNMNLDATSLSSSTFSDSSMYDNIFGDIEDMTRFSSRFLSDVVSHDDEKFLMLDESCLENTSFMRELTMIFQEDRIETTSLCDSHVTLVDEANDSFKGIDNYFG